MLPEALAEVCIQVFWTKYAGHLSGGCEIVFKNRFQAILCLGVPESVHRICFCLAVDVRYPPAIAVELDFLGFCRAERGE